MKVPIFTTTNPDVSGIGPARDMLVGDDGDLVIQGGDLALAAGAIAAAQATRQAVSLFQGEWFLDTTAGVPYWTRIFVKNPNLVEIQEWFRQAILAVPDVDRINFVNVTYTGQRTVEVDWSAQLVSGVSITGTGAIT